MRSSNRACFGSGAQRLSPELSFCSFCPWLFLSPSAFCSPPVREEEKSSTRRGVTKSPLLLLCLPRSTRGMMPRGMLGGAGHILGFNDFFFFFPPFQGGFGPRGEGQVWGALQQREWEGQGVVCPICERPGKGSAGGAAGILHRIWNSLRPGGIYLYPKEVFLDSRNSRKVRNHSTGRYRSE